MTGENTLEAVVALLEVTASGHPQVLDFQLRTLLNSHARSAVYDLASTFDVAHEQVGVTVYRACVDLDRLERRRGGWRDPAEILDSPNLPALLHVCQARVYRISKIVRQRRLKRILRKLTHAHELARSRAWIEAFIGEPLPKKRPDVQRADG